MSARTRRASAASRGSKHVQLPSPATVLTGSAPPAAGKVASGKAGLQDVRESMMSRLEEMKNNLEESHASFAKELATSTARLSKRVKLDLQSSKKIAEDVDNEHRDFIADSAEDFNEIQVACEEITAATQSPFSKTAVPELMKSLEKSIEALRSKYTK